MYNFYENYVQKLQSAMPPNYILNISQLYVPIKTRTLSIFQRYNKSQIPIYNFQYSLKKIDFLIYFFRQNVQFPKHFGGEIPLIYLSIIFIETPFQLPSNYILKFTIFLSLFSSKNFTISKISKYNFYKNCIQKPQP